MGIERNGAGEAGERRRVGFSGPTVNSCHATQEMVIGIEAVGRLALCAIDLSPLQLGRNGAHDACRDLVLEIKDVRELSFKPVGP